MALFGSAFESSAGAGPSFTPPSKSQSGQKRKRTSLGADSNANKDGQLRSTQANLQKLMKGLESQSQSQSQTKAAKSSKIPRDGGENMGSIKIKKKSSKQVEHEHDHDHGRYDADSPARPASIKGKKPVPVKHELKSHDSPAGSKDKSSKQDTVKKQKPKSNLSAGGSKVEPAELSLPHNIRAHESSDTEGLTKMQKDMKAKLEGARFRWINEQLYSTPSTDAVAMMQQDPKIFSDYHLTHRALTSAWPSPPLPHIISLLSPLPARTVIADLGCGDAGLARALVPQGKIVLSYDLVGDRGNVGGGNGEGWVVEADFLSSVPLPGRPGGSGSSLTTKTPEAGKGKRAKKGSKAESSEIVDAVVCCLSLMGTNWIGGIYEACRILKQGGSFHIAEVTSRFVSTESFTQKVESFGLELVSESSPSTHFTLFEFKKVVEVPVGPVKGEAGWEKRVAEGGEILRPCVYKKR